MLAIFHTRIMISAFNLIEWKYRVHQMAVKNITYSSAFYIGLMYSTERIANKENKWWH